jgi:hypothetical protein
MQISILSVEKSTPPGKKYVVAEVSYKNLTFGKVESKKIFSFGAQEQAFKAIADSKHGDVFDIEVKKNDAGYNDWVKASQQAPGATTQAPVVAASGFTPKPAWQGETSEERAKKQTYIVRQSSISAAVAALCAGAKTPPTADSVISYAQQLERFVFSENKPSDNLFTMPNDLPQDVDVE